MARVHFTDEWLAVPIEGIIGAERLDTLRNAAGVKPTLWETVVSTGDVKDDDILEAVAARFRFKVADLSESERPARDLVPEQVARRYHVLPIRVSDSVLEIATGNPFDLDCEKTLSFATGREVRTLLASPTAIQRYLDELYRPDNVIDQLLEGMGEADITQLTDQHPADELIISEAEASQRPVVRLVDVILSEGIVSRASDIHVEPAEGGVAVRYRIDGVLREVMKIPRGAGLPLISRFKIIASLDIADRLRPQDGRARVAVNGMPVDLRVSTLPASLGEKVVVRILDSRHTVLSLDSLGMRDSERELIERLLSHRDGILLVTGPTGSGKTTTLYSALRHIQSEGVNIVTVEDPVEYRVKGIVQVQVHEKAGLTFASALRSILRQDPDVVLIGEIRDQETAQIALQASLTGHLVLSTLHTNDAPNAITRLVDIGMENFKIASALRGVVAQRLMRALCKTCNEPIRDPAPDELAEWVPEGTTLYRAVGCPECAMTGYRGRFSILEILVISPEVEISIGAGETADRIFDIGRANGMETLWDSGLARVLHGESTIDELLRVVDMPSKRKKPAAREKIPPPSAQTAASRPSPPAVSAPPPVQSSEPIIPGAGAPPATVPRSLPFDFELADGIDDGAGDVAAPTEVDGARGTVLLVDDEDQLRRVMSDLLARDGFKVIQARDGSEALNQVDRHLPDIIVLDLNLPGLDGYSVLSQLRSRPETGGIPIIVLTAKGDEDNEVRVFELGADDFMSKPFRAKALSARLTSLLKRSRR